MRAIALRTIKFLILLLVATLPLAAESSDGQLQFANLGSCKLVSGQQIQQCRLGYRTWGKLNAQHSNAILFPTWFTGTSGNIERFVGADKMLDPSKYFIVAIDAFGDGVSSSPSNSTSQHGPAFPAFSLQDMVDAEYRFATETLHFQHVHAVIGISMGGMQTFEWIVDYPDFMDLAISIVGSPRLATSDLLLWHAEEGAIKQDPDWHGGHYTKPPALAEVQLIHQMNTTSPSAFSRNISRDRFDSTLAEYLSHGTLPIDANDRLSQLEAMIHHDIAHGGSLEDAAKRVKAMVLAIPSQQDHMVNPQPSLDFAPLIRARILLLRSDCGHSAPVCEANKVFPAVQDFLTRR